VSFVFDEEKYCRWVRGARITLESARYDVEHGFFNWACFKARQAAEKALKAVLWGAGRLGLGALSCIFSLRLRSSA